ncbi:hypothetical protein THAR02_06495 [Trichoderma harzianum]|uniref:Uncharacterized protein n=1 Tax=Trichoderma harzianum TaxID=5544 RepID=A0A0F9ZMD7_TRIHA|nr:hypothetical protein THAR02_06495 [Trichoderma harzianum]
MPAALAKEAMKNPNFTAAVRQLRDKKGVKFEADSNGARAAGQSRLAFVISSTVVGQKTCAAQAFRTPADIYYAKKKERDYNQNAIEISWPRIFDSPSGYGNLEDGSGGTNTCWVKQKYAFTRYYLLISALDIHFEVP